MSATYPESEEQIEVKQKEVDNWAGVAALFGSADGKKFRNIAQSYVLRQLLAVPIIT